MAEPSITRRQILVGAGATAQAGCATRASIDSRIVKTRFV
jgi:hypothetical protein